MKGLFDHLEKSFLTILVLLLLIPCTGIHAQRLSRDLNVDILVNQERARVGAAQRERHRRRYGRGAPRGGPDRRSGSHSLDRHAGARGNARCRRVRQVRDTRVVRPACARHAGDARVRQLETARRDLGDRNRPGENQRPAGRVEDPEPQQVVRL